MRWIVSRYSYGPEEWNVDDLVYNWENTKTLVDEDAKLQIQLGIIDQKDVPEEKFIPATIVTVPGSNTGISALTYTIEDAIHVSESEDKLDVFQAVYLN